MDAPPRPLIVGYGNPLRADDGAGWRAAEALAAVLGERAEVIACHQLMPELAEPLSRAPRALFIDASVEGEPGTIAERAVAPGEGARPLSHHVSAEALLLLAGALFGRTPPATLLTVSGAEFGHGDALSPAVAAALPALVERGIRFIEENEPCTSTR